jgi:16S rRNA A1518/A1519 N6-dimethyltransferase RsmA/KsgA/DIM1 with predicted DNA glycosylase/AP lyase activity
MKLGKFLIQNHLITTGQLNEALEIQKGKPEQKIGEILVGLGYLTSEALQNALENHDGQT